MQAQGDYPAFPPTRDDVLACATERGTRGLRLRAATLADLPFMRRLYGELRAEELKQVAWPDSASQAFLDSQFALQHRHFVTYYAAADFFMVEQDGVTIGRYYFLREPPYFLVVDIALLPAWRGRGIGRALLDVGKKLAQQSHAQGVELHVDERNAGARRLYDRLGFLQSGQNGPYIGMRWSVAPEF